jgi:tetratricopeptide (TPR) repeat protein
VTSRGRFGYCLRQLELLTNFIVKFLTMKTILTLCIGLSFGLLSLPMAHGQGGKEAEATKLAREGSHAAKDQDYDKAIATLRKAAELDRKFVPNLSAAYQQRGFQFTNEQRFEDAINDFNEAIKITPHDERAYQARASLEIKINDLDRATTDYTEAIKINPDDVHNYLYRGYIYELRGDVKNSMADTDRVLKSQPKNQEALGRKERLKKIEASQNATAAQPANPVPAPAKPPKKP